MNKIAAIDLGSNAVRFVIAQVSADGSLSTFKKFREPVRLGHDVFTQGVITPETEAKAIVAFKKFKRLIDRHEVKVTRAIATSATREAQNGDHFAARIREQTGIPLQLIDGIEEARLVHWAVKKELDLREKNTLLIDIGGGSVELTYSKGDQLIATESFKIGTVRLLEALKKRNLSESHINDILSDFASPMRAFIRAKKMYGPLDFAVGTGGNFEALGRLKLQLLGTTPNTYLEAGEVQAIGEKLKSYSFSEKVDQLSLRKDRADVIVPAVAVTEIILQDACVPRVMIPYVGLKDGILWQAFSELKK